MVLSMNRTVTQCIDLAMTEHILVSHCDSWCSWALGLTDESAVYDATVASLHHKASSEHHVVITPRHFKHPDKVLAQSASILTDTRVSLVNPL